MRSLYKVLGLVLALLIFLFLLMPPLIGLIIQKWGNTQLIFSNFENMTVDTLEYHRGWFHSDVISEVRIKDPNIHHILELARGTKNEIPETIVFTLNEHIFHGPIFYENTFDWRKIGVALIDRKFIISPAQKKFFANVGINDETISDRTYINLAGNTLERISLDHLNMDINDMQIHFASVHSDISQSLFSNRIKAKVILNHFIIEDESDTLSVPFVSLQLNVKKNALGLWLGWQKLTIPDFRVMEDGKTYFELRGLNLETGLSQHGNFLKLDNQLSFEKLDVDKDSFGNFKLDSTMNYLSAEALTNLIESYQYIRKHGELYESQMRRKMMAMLPKLIIPGSTWEIKKLHFTTNEGQLQIQGIANWSSDSNISPDDFAEIYELSDLNGSVRVSIPLVRNLVGDFAELSYIYQLPLTERLKLITIQNNERTMSRQYANMLVSLVKNKELPDEEGMYLVVLARSRSPVDEYLHQVKRLLLARKISLEVSYLLGWQYGEFNKQKRIFEQKLEQFKESATKELNTQVNDYLKKGYIARDKNDYLIFIERKNGVLKMNGRQVT